MLIVFGKCAESVDYACTNKTVGPKPIEVANWPIWLLTAFGFICQVEMFKEPPAPSSISGDRQRLRHSCDGFGRTVGSGLCVS